MNEPHEETHERAAGAVPLAGLYFLYFASVGILLPFLPAYLRSLGLRSAQVGALLATQPALALVAPLGWGYLVDRHGRPDRVLRAIAIGATATFAALLWVQSFGALGVVLTGYALFASSVTPVIDSLALQQVAAGGGSYARLRRFGSLGFVVSSALFGFLVPSVDRRAVAAPLLLMAAYSLWSWRVKARTAVSPQVSSPLSGIRLLRRPQVALFLIATTLHWVACAPWNLTLALHISALGLKPWVVGLSASLGVLAELGVMSAYPRLTRALSPRLVLVASCGVTALRWAGMGWAESGPFIVFLSMLHGMTFGAFYVACVGYMSDQVGASMRASGQALFVAATFGVGGLFGYLGAGALYDQVGGHRLFLLAAGLDCLAMSVALCLNSAPHGYGEIESPEAASALG